MGERRIVGGRIIERTDQGTFIDHGPVTAVGQSPIRVQQVQGEIAGRDASTAKTNAETPFVAPQAIANINRDNASAANTQAGLPKVNAEAASAVRLNGLPPETYVKALTQYRAAMQLDDILGKLETEYKAGPGATKGIAGLFRDNWDPTVYSKFNNIGNQARGISRNALGLTGGEANTAAEMQQNLGSYVPDASNLDSTIESQIDGLKRIRDNARDASIQMLGGIPDESGNIMPLSGLIDDVRKNVESVAQNAGSGQTPSPRKPTEVVGDVNTVLRKALSGGLIPPPRKNANPPRRASSWWGGDPELDALMNKYAGTR